MAKMKFLLKEQIDRARGGLSQTWIVARMNEKGVKMSESQFSRKKKGYDKFSEIELSALGEILNVELSA